MTTTQPTQPIAADMLPPRHALRRHFESRPVTDMERRLIPYALAEYDAQIKAAYQSIQQTYMDWNAARVDLKERMERATSEADTFRRIIRRKSETEHARDVEAGYRATIKHTLREKIPRLKSERDAYNLRLRGVFAAITDVLGHEGREHSDKSLKSAPVQNITVSIVLSLTDSIGRHRLKAVG